MNEQRKAVSALWPSRPFQVSVLADDGREWTVPIDRPYARVGGLPHMEVVLDGPDVPRRGLYLHSTAEGVYCLSLERKQSKEYSPNCWLTPQSYVKLAGFRLRASFVDGLPTPTAPHHDLRTKLANRTRVPMVVVHTPQGPVREPIDHSLTVIGSERPSRIRLTHPTISGTHCLLYWDQTTLWVVDLYSSRGTLLDGESIDASRVRPGQTITLGRIDIQIEIQAAGAEDAAAPVAEGRYLSSREISNDEALERLLKHFKGKLKREA